MNEEMKFPETFEQFAREYGFKDSKEVYTNGSDLIQVFRVKQWLGHEMSVEEYRQRMIQAFHNADCDELIATCALPTEKGFKHLEWLLKNHYKKEPCEECVGRQAVLDAISRIGLQKSDTKEVQAVAECLKAVEVLPLAVSQQRTGHWIEDEYEMKVWCSECGEENDECSKHCPNCGAKMITTSSELQESEESDESID